MAIAPMEDFQTIDVSLEFVRAALAQAAERLVGSGRTVTTSEAVRTLVGIEDISRLVDHLQVFAAGMAEGMDLAAGEKPPGVGSLQVRAEQFLGGTDDVGAAGDPTSGGSAGGRAGGTGGDGSGQAQFRHCADYLRARLGISRGEAKRRLVLAHGVLPGISPAGAPIDPPLETLGVALGSGTVSGRAATVICAAVERVRCVASPDQLASMEHHLTLQAIESDEDVLRILARRWETVLDQDGVEPTEKVLRARQGVFFRGRRNGLHILEIGATDEQLEHLSTVMNTATNPRVATPQVLGDSGDSPCAGGLEPTGDLESTGAPESTKGVGGGSSLMDPPESPTRAQSLLDGLVGACRIALSSTQLPATGGLRPQVMVTIDYRDLLADVTTAGKGGTNGVGSNGAGTNGVGSNRNGGTADIAGTGSGTSGTGGTGGTGGSAGAGNGRTGSGTRSAGSQNRSGTGRAIFAEQLSARSIRRIACDADIIPLVLGGDGQVLDIGRAGRLFPPHLRRALVARDRGCAFPDCTIPASWCEAHHMTPWSHGGATSIDNGVLLCAHHHHVIHLGHWSVASRNGIPWFTPPPHLARHGTTARRNRYWHARPALHSSTDGCTIGGTGSGTGTGTGTAAEVDSARPGVPPPGRHSSTIGGTGAGTGTGVDSVLPGVPRLGQHPGTVGGTGTGLATGIATGIATGTAAGTVTGVDSVLPGVPRPGRHGGTDGEAGPILAGVAPPA